MKFLKLWFFNHLRQTEFVQMAVNETAYPVVQVFCLLGYCRETILICENYQLAIKTNWASISTAKKTIPTRFLFGSLLAVTQFQLNFVIPTNKPFLFNLGRLEIIYFASQIILILPSKVSRLSTYTSISLTKIHQPNPIIKHHQPISFARYSWTSALYSFKQSRRLFDKNSVVLSSPWLCA